MGKKSRDNDTKFEAWGENVENGPSVSPDKMLKIQSDHSKSPEKIVRNYRNPSVTPGKHLKIQSRHSKSPEKVIKNCWCPSVTPEKTVKIQSCHSKSPENVIKNHRSPSITPEKFLKIQSRHSKSPEKVIKNHRSPSITPEKFLKIQSRHSKSPEKVIKNHRSPSITPEKFLKIQSRHSKSPEKIVKNQLSPSVVPENLLNIQSHHSISPEKNIKDQWNPSTTPENVLQNRLGPATSPEKVTKNQSSHSNSPEKNVIEESPTKSNKDKKESKRKEKKCSNTTENSDAKPRALDNGWKFRKMIRSIKDADLKKPCKVHGYSTPPKKNCGKGYHRSTTKHPTIEEKVEDKAKSELGVFSTLDDASQVSDKSPTYPSTKSILKSNGDKVSKMKSNIKFDFLPSTWSSTSWKTDPQNSSTFASHLSKSRYNTFKSSQSQIRSCSFARNHQSSSLSGSFPHDHRFSSPGHPLGLYQEAPGSKVRVSPLSQILNHGRIDKDSRRSSRASINILSKFNQIYENPDLYDPGSKRSMLSLLQKRYSTNNTSVPYTKKPLIYSTNVTGKPRHSPKVVCHSHPTAHTEVLSATSIHSESFESDFDVISLLSSQSETINAAENAAQHQTSVNLRCCEPNCKSSPLRQLNQQQRHTNTISSSESSEMESSCSFCSGMFRSNVPSSRMDGKGVADENWLSDFYGPKYRMSLRNQVCNKA
ncbi:unnamed protein product [Bemisia tabaci]|uniref:Uncharacterized protein n=1 Tax=Bemisia tabaci TaxID=7038 RepID=A0A9P0F171_BEMTA|nr:unnamed protein product [Bemisia tabaci]